MEERSYEMAALYDVTIKWILALIDKHKKGATPEQVAVLDTLRKEITG